MGARATWTAIATCLSCLGATEQAVALGVLQSSPGTATVRSHRIALSVSDERTVLWDEFSYDAFSSDFLWLLPVRPGATFDVANPAWFDALEAVTRPRVAELDAECVSVDTGGCACTGSAPQPGYYDYGSYDDGSTTVTVVRTNTIGPYRTNLLSSSDPGALSAYIQQGGYVVPPGFDSTISAYMADGFDFLAVSVRPTAGVLDLKPIRVVTPGGAAVLPIRMLSANAAPVVNVELYVIAEGRRGLPELTEVTLKPGRLAWDSSTQSSNFDLVESEALAQNDGFSFFTAFASGGPFALRQLDSEGRNVRFMGSGGSFDTFADLYFAQARLESATAGQPCSSIVSLLQSDLKVTDANPVPQGQLDDLFFACGPVVDLQQALIGLRPARTWLTRVDLELPADALFQDFLVEPSASGVTVRPDHEASRLLNAPSSCYEPIFRSSVAPHRVRPFGWASVPLVFLAVALRRRFRRARGAA